MAYSQNPPMHGKNFFLFARSDNSYLAVDDSGTMYYALSENPYMVEIVISMVTQVRSFYCSTWVLLEYSFSCKVTKVLYISLNLFERC